MNNTPKPLLTITQTFGKQPIEITVYSGTSDLTFVLYSQGEKAHTGALYLSGIVPELVIGWTRQDLPPMIGPDKALLLDQLIKLARSITLL